MLVTGGVLKPPPLRLDHLDHRARPRVSPGFVERNFQVYFNDIGTDRERDDWVIASLDVTPPSAILDELT